MIRPVAKRDTQLGYLRQRGFVNRFPFLYFVDSQQVYKRVRDTNDTTFGYIVVDVERLREPMQMITNEFLRLCNQKTQAQDYLLTGQK